MPEARSTTLRRPGQATGEQLSRLNRREGERRLLESRLGPYAEGLAALFEEQARNPRRSNTFAGVLPFFQSFDGPKHIAAVALSEALFRLGGEAHTYVTFCQFLGKAVQLEERYIQLARERPQTAARMQTTFRNKRAIVSNDAMRALNVVPQELENRKRAQIGIFLLEVMLASTGLVQVRKRLTWNGHLQRIVVSTPEAEAFLRAVHVDRALPAYTLPEGEPAPDWTSIWSDDLLTDDSLVQLPVHQRHDKRAYAYLEEHGIKNHLLLANAVQQIGMRVDPWMVDLQRQAWEAGIQGLFPCKRTPEDLPSVAGVLQGLEGYRVRAREKEELAQDLWKNRGVRIRMERMVQAAERSAGAVIHTRALFDFRGRLYCRGSLLSHQGTEQEKALLSFDKVGPVGVDGLEWMFWAAAGHWGMGKESRQERRRWGKENLPMMRSLVEAPLDRLELWRGCKEPWLFLQLARAIVMNADEIGRGGEGRSGVPVRMDQTCSGLGIISALLKDPRLATLTNVAGSDREDIYLEVLAKAMKRMEADLQGCDRKVASNAEKALALEPDRSLVKKVVLALPYGLSRLGVTRFCEEWVEDKVGFVPFDEYKWVVGVPANYLASVVWAAAREMTGEITAIDRWLGKCVKTAFKGGRQWFEWSTPAGFPVRLSAREKKLETMSIKVLGRQISMNIQTQALEHEISVAETKKGIGAHYIHSLESGVCHAVLQQMLSQDLPVATVHDCFAARPCDAAELKRVLHTSFRGTFSSDWLSITQAEIELETGLEMPPPPPRGELDGSRIGLNDHLYS